MPFWHYPTMVYVVLHITSDFSRFLDWGLMQYQMAVLYIPSEVNFLSMPVSYLPKITKGWMRHLLSVLSMSSHAAARPVSGIKPFQKDRELLRDFWLS
ncbi:hypothetical protein P3L10_030177 [Capsicum annuum]